MEYKWLNRAKNNKLIIFFNGWGMDEEVVNHLEFEDFDILMFYDYNNLETDFAFSELKDYPKKHLVAWSMGVMISTLFDIEYNSKTAINGTLKPINQEFGINPRIYDLTTRGFNEEGRKKFVSSMFNEPTELKLNRDLNNQKSELAAIKNIALTPTICPLLEIKDFGPLPKEEVDLPAGESTKYTRILISDNDKIIPTKNQVAFWNQEPNIHAGHCPFFEFKRWGELL